MNIRKFCVEKNLPHKTQNIKKMWLAMISKEKKVDFLENLSFKQKISNDLITKEELNIREVLEHMTMKCHHTTVI